MSASRPGKEVVTLSKARSILLLVIAAALLASIVGGVHVLPAGMSGGGYW
jgi:hypothetical protein